MKPALLLFTLILAAQAFADPALVIKNVTVIDATGAAAIPERTVIFRNSVIAEIGPAAATKIPPGATVVDGSGKYLIPGLWDMHVHLALVEQPDWTRKVCLPLLVANGVTGVRDMGGNFEVIRQVRNEIESGALAGPRIVTPGPMLDGPGKPFPPVIHLETEEAAKAAVDSLQSMQVDFVKVLSSLPRNIYFAIADESRKRKMVFVGHVPQAITVAEASDAGQKSIEHMDGVLLGCSSQETALRSEINEALKKSDFQAFTGLRTRMIDSFDAQRAAQLYARFVKNGTWQTPTFAYLRTLASVNEAEALAGDAMRFVPEDIAKQWKELVASAGQTQLEGEVGKRRFQKNLEVVGQMKKAGVGILAGTDTDGETPFLVPGFSLHDELKTLVQAGLTPMEALQSATLNAAKFLGLEKTEGTLEKGKTANAVLLDANPLLDIANTRRISMVIVRGKQQPPSP